MLRLLLIAIALLPAPQAPAFGQTAKAPELLLFHPETRTGAEEQVVRQVEGAMGEEARVTIYEDSALEELGGPDAGRDVRLRVYHAMRRAEAQGAWTITFLRSQGVVVIEAFDNGQGVRAVLGTKIRSMARDRLSDEHLVRLDETITAVRNQLAEKIRFLETSRTSPYCETVSWRHSEVPPHPGFRWVFEEQGARVTYVYETSSLQKAGLQPGDLIVSINGTAVPSPPHLGRALGPLRAGHELKLVVLRGEETVELAGKVESSAELIPRWQAGIVGKQAPLPGTPTGAGSPSSSEPGRRAVLIVVYRPAMPETWECFSVLRWIRDHHPEQELAIVGIAANTDEQTLSRFLDEEKPGWPSLPDPDGRLTDALRVHLPPAFLLVDKEGVLRFLQVDEARLSQAIDTITSG
ncbi:MAG: PDZ domain-containing protein [Planctomycetota bacterium]